MSKLSFGLIQLGYNVGDNYACSNQATYQDIKDTWVHKNPVPKEEDIVKASDEWEKEYASRQYQRDRAVAYDPIKEQLDQIYHDIDGWKAKIKAVKDKYPKPSE